MIDRLQWSVISAILPVLTTTPNQVLELMVNRPNAVRRSVTILLFAFFMGLESSDSCWAQKPQRIVLIAGDVTRIDTVGHHDYSGGIKGLDYLLRQTANVECVAVENGWPNDESVFHGATAVVLYTDGGGKQAFFASPERVAKMQSLVDSKVGVVLI
jgi:hypothetical protein